MLNTNVDMQVNFNW